MTPRHLAALLAFSAFAANAADLTVNGRGVARFASAQCPLAGATQCNRIAVDAAGAVAEVDHAAKRIRFSPGAAPNGVLGDVVLHGRAVGEAGDAVPVALHVVLEKGQRGIRAKAHAHATVRGRLSQLSLDAYAIEAPAGTVVFAPERAAAVIEHPALSARAAGHVVDVVDAPPAPDARADATVTVLGKPVVRLRLFAAGSAPLRETLDGGTWQLEVRPLTRLLPRDVLHRDLFLFGLEGTPLERALDAVPRTRRLPAFALGVDAAGGFLTVDGARQPLPQARDVVRRFLQESFLGAVLLHRSAR